MYKTLAIMKIHYVPVYIYDVEYRFLVFYSYRIATYNNLIVLSLNYTVAIYLANYVGMLVICSARFKKWST